MTKQEKKLILDLSLQSLTKKDFLRQYPTTINKDYVLTVLKNAYEKRNADDVEYSLLLFFLFNLSSNIFIDVLCKILQESWHYKHEDIVLILQELKSADSVDAIYNTALKKFDYLNYDDSYSLARKCIHALGDINTEYSNEKLKLLATSEIPIVREKAEKQLHYYKR